MKIYQTARSQKERKGDNGKLSTALFFSEYFFYLFIYFIYFFFHFIFHFWGKIGPVLRQMKGKKNE